LRLVAGFDLEDGEQRWIISLVPRVLARFAVPAKRRSDNT
jgi:hypothetical protein